MAFFDVMGTKLKVDLTEFGEFNDHDLQEEGIGSGKLSDVIVFPDLETREMVIVVKGKMSVRLTLSQYNYLKSKL